MRVATAEDFKIPTVSIDMNDAAILASIAKNYIAENVSYLSDAQTANWKTLIAKLTPKAGC